MLVYQKSNKKLLCPPEELCSREEGWLQADHVQREDKLNVSNVFRAGNIKNYLGQWSFITTDRFIIETVKWGLKIDFSNKPVHKNIPKIAHSTKEK